MISFVENAVYNIFDITDVFFHFYYIGNEQAEKKIYNEIKSK